ncbi:MAG: pteridine reductase [Betaproteobacteria bacterium]|nr:MAG: pteridine reductase [Betaproteobacteria bacterium]
MSGALAGKVVLVTGGARRVGAAICRRLHAADANVVVHYHRSAADAQALLRDLNSRRANSVALVCADLLVQGALSRLVKDALAAFGRLDVLVNNASTFYPTPVGGINEQAWNDLVGTNLKVPLFLAQAAAPELRKGQGSIVNIIDIHAELPLKNHLVYNAAKGGLLALTRSLARELGPQVRVNGVSPGTILWPDDPAWQNDVERQRIVNQTVLKRTGEPDDIARAVEFLITAPYVTGQIIAVDGGRSISIA